MAGFPFTETLGGQSLQRDRTALQMALLEEMSRPEADYEEIRRLQQALAMAKGNVTRGRRLEGAGVDVMPTLEPTEPGGVGNVLSSVFRVLDKPRAVVAKRAIAPAMEWLGLTPPGSLTGREDIRGSHLIQ